MQVLFCTKQLNKEKTLNVEKIPIGIDTRAEWFEKGIDCGDQVDAVKLFLGLIQGIQVTMSFGACLRLQNVPDKVVERI